MNVAGFEHYIGLIALGVGVGAYGTLIGAGGGFVLMPVLAPSLSETKTQIY